MQKGNKVKQLFASCVMATLLVITSAEANTNRARQANRAWQPFFTKFLAAVRKRDRKALKQMMVSDIFFSGGGGDDNHDGDTRDEAFKFWDAGRAWKAIEKTLEKGTVPLVLWWNDGEAPKYPSRVAPPIANQKGNHSFPYYAIFEFRPDGKWYCVILNGCCD